MSESMESTHEARLKRARVALEGLSVGDALGGFFELGLSPYNSAFYRERRMPKIQWRFTDDTNMALSIYQILRKFGEIKQDELAESFAQYFDRTRGYGLGARHLMLALRDGRDWRVASREMFYGTGSYGNGGAMRVAPIGAYFADDILAAIENARLSAEITHAHPEGVASAIAVAVATACAWRLRESGDRPSRSEFIDLVLPHIPEGEVRAKSIEARDLADSMAIWPDVVAAIGNGSGVSAQDTVPFVLWSAGERLDHYEEAIWQTVSAGGDVDTTCAMVGGIVASYVGTDHIPSEWIASRESLPGWALGE